MISTVASFVSRNISYVAANYFGITRNLLIVDFTRRIPDVRFYIKNFLDYFKYKMIHITNDYEHFTQLRELFLRSTHNIEGTSCHVKRNISMTRFFKKKRKLRMFVFFLLLIIPGTNFERNR